MPAKAIVEQNPLREDTDDEEFEYVTTPPDGGFGWVVAFAAMVRPFPELHTICIYCGFTALQSRLRWYSVRIRHHEIASSRTFQMF